MDPVLLHEYCRLRDEMPSVDMHIVRGPEYALRPDWVDHPLPGYTLKRRRSCTCLARGSAAPAGSTQQLNCADAVGQQRSWRRRIEWRRQGSHGLTGG